MRVRTGITRRRRHKKILKQTKGFRMTKSKLYKTAKQASLHAGQYAFHGRKLRKRDMRRLWIQRINAALTDSDLKYSHFIKNLKDKKIDLDRKVLAELAINQTQVFQAIIKFVKP